MGVFLLDVNVLIALAWPEHEFHERAGRWFLREGHTGWATCPFTQAAFVRILSNPAFSAGALTPRSALQVLESNLNLPGHRFWADAIPVPEGLRSTEHRLTGHRQVAGAYLIGLAVHYRGRLATMDRGLRELGSKTAVEWIE